MSQYYNPNRLTHLYNPDSRESFRLSRSKIRLSSIVLVVFILIVNLGLHDLLAILLLLNIAVDKLLKNEFDFTGLKAKHPLMDKYGIDAVPFAHPEIE